MWIDREMYLGPGLREKEKATWLFDGDTLILRGEGPIGRKHGRGPFERMGRCALDEWNDFRFRVRHAVVEEGITGIGGQYFMGCENLESVSLPESLTEIRAEAFCGCRSLRDLTLPHDLRWLGHAAFDGCRSLEEIEIPPDVMFLGDCLFRGCSSLRRVKLHESLQEIHEAVFAGCCLEELEIPRGVKAVSCDAFRDLSLTGEDPDVEGLCADGVLYTMHVRSPEMLFLSPKIRRIGPHALGDVWSRLLFIPNSVTDVCPRALCGARVRSLYLGTGVTRLERDLLLDCGPLETVYIAGELAAAESSWLGDTDGVRIITRQENAEVLEDCFRRGGNREERYQRVRYLPAGNPAAVECEFYRESRAALKGLRRAPAYPLTMEHVMMQ